MGAKELILRKIRAANRTASNAGRAAEAWNRLPREYTRMGSRGHEAVLELLEDRLRDYDATVVRCGAEVVAEWVGRILGARAVRGMLISEGFPAVWMPKGVDFEVDLGLEPAILDRFEGVLTTSFAAIAETGTIVLQTGPGQGRRAISLVPDYHLCIVGVEDVVETVPEAMARLQATAGLATTFISGPSATADIEMTRIKGVHGPRFLDVLLVG